MGYRFRDADRSPDYGGSGVGFFRPNAPVLPIFPKFRNYGLVARIYPTKEGGHILPYRFSAEEKDYTDWIRRYPVARFAGMDKDSAQSFILYDESQADNEYHDNPWYTNPYGALFYQVNKEVNKLEKQEASMADVSWLPLVRGRMTQKIPRPTIGYFVQGYVLHLPRDEGNAFERDANLTEVIVLQKSAGSSLVDELERRFRNYCEDPLRYDPMNDRFDPLRFDAGCLFSWHRKNEGEFDSYHVSVSDQDLTLPDGRVIPVRFNQEQVDYAVNKILPFDEVLDVPTARDLALRLIRLYKPILHILEFAWTKVDPHWLDDELLGMLRSRKQVASPGVPQSAPVQAPVSPSVAPVQSGTIKSPTPSQEVVSPTTTQEAVQSSSPAPTTVDVESEVPFDVDDDYAKAFEEARRRANRPL